MKTIKIILVLILTFGCAAQSTTNKSDITQRRFSDERATASNIEDAAALISNIEMYDRVTDENSYEALKTLNQNDKLLSNILEELTEYVEVRFDDMWVVIEKLKATNGNGNGNETPDTPPRFAAFPTAYGAAYNATGGRGGTVHKVTNLNNSGAGSFRDAVNGDNRIVVFDVSGTIELTTDLVINDNNISILGQTAPQGGITITGSGEFYLSGSDNTIIRYVRFRPNYDSSGSVDAVNIQNATNFIFDHCSISYGGDEAMSVIDQSYNVTIQNCIMAESATGMLAGDSSEPSSTNFSILNNLWYNISHRFPNVVADRTDLINNLVYNHYSTLKVVSNRDGAKLNEINNYYQPGTTTYGDPESLNYLDIGSASQRPNIRIYTDGNVYQGYLTEAQNDWNLYVHRFAITSGAYAGTSQFDPASTDFQVLTPFTLLGDTPNILTASQVRSNILLNAGANKYIDDNGYVQKEWDDVDNIYLTNVNNNTSEGYVYPPTAITSKQSYIDFHNSVSSTPIITRPGSYDTDNDGISDAWEMREYGTLSNSYNDVLGDDDYDVGHLFWNSVDY